MEEETSTINEGAASSGVELEVFRQVATALNRLDHEGRIRMFRTLAAYFELGFGRTAVPVHTGQVAERNNDGSPQHRFSEDRAPSPKEFMVSKEPKTDVERIACLAYYLTHYREMPHFKTLDLSKLNTEAAQLKFSNAANATDNATRTGLLVPAAKGHKQISHLGEAYVQALPDRDAAKIAIANRRPRRKLPRLRKADKKDVAPAPSNDDSE